MEFVWRIIAQWLFIQTACCLIGYPDIILFRLPVQTTVQFESGRGDNADLVSFGYLMAIYIFVKSLVDQCSRL